ncbi:MAG: hypothetical protein NVV74_15760 [Magnetospirillum sp.]|nr:hypothetical protein [Magnetospirillum sp.]
MNSYAIPPRADISVVEVVMVTPCRECLREAKYTVLQVASGELAVWAAGLLGHDERHELVYLLEQSSEQLPVDRCECGADGAETGSATLIHLSRREATGSVAPDQSYEIVSVRVVEIADQHTVQRPTS